MFNNIKGFFYAVIIEKCRGGPCALPGKRRIMIKKVLLSVLFCCVVINSVAFADDSSGSEKKTNVLYDLISLPFKTILAPIEGGGLVDLVLAPARVILSPVPDLLDIVVTPGRTKEYIYNLNKNVSVVSREELKEKGPSNIQQMLIMEPGVVLGGYLNNAKDSNIDIRGFGGSGLSNYLVLVDGRRTNQIDLSGPDLSQIDVNVIERIEILRGAGTVLYGDNATGGVINIITKKSEKGDKIEYRQELGSYQYHKEYVSAIGSHDFLDYTLSLSHQNSDGYRLNNGYEANDGFISVKMKPSENFNLTSTAGYHRDWYGLAGALYDGNLQGDGREGSRFPDSKAKTEDYYYTLNPDLYLNIGDHEIKLSSLASYRGRRSNSRDVGFNVYETNHHIMSYELKPKAEINSDLFNGKAENKLVLGIDYFYARDEVLSGDTAFAKSQIDIIKETLGLYASDNILINKRFIISGGVRGEWAEYVFDQRAPADSYNTRSLRDMAFDLGLGYKYNERSQVYMNYARSYRFPATDEYFTSAYETFDWWTFSVMVFPSVLNTALKQQVGNNYEIGIKDNSFDFLRIKSAYYYIDNKNEIYLDPYIPENPENDMNENYKNTVHHGLELEVNVEILDDLSTFLNYTFQKSYFVGGKYASKTMPLVPENKISAGVVFYPIDGLNLNISANYMGSRYAANDLTNNTSKLESNLTMDMGAAYEYKNIKIFVFVRNLLDEGYFSNATKNWQGNLAFYPAKEREFGFGVEVKF